MVNMFHKRPTELFLPVITSDFGTEHLRGKSPSRSTHKLPTTPVRTNSVERKFKLIRKKSSKDKEQLIRGNVLDVKAECPSPTKSTNKIIKNKTTNKAFTNGKLFDAVLDNDFSLTRKCLILEEMDVNEYSPEGTTVLHLASAAGNLDCLELLLECGAKVNCTDVNCRTPLEYAVLYGNFECAALLIENGADTKAIKNGIH